MNNTITPSVLIIVLNWMKYEDTIACVKSLQKLTYSNFTICIVDNGSLNESAQVLQESFPYELFIQSPINNGYAAGNKLGVDYALAHNFDAVWILNNDCTVRPDSLTELVAAYGRHGNALYSNLTLMSENPDIIHYAGTYQMDEELQPDKYPTYDKWKGKQLDEVSNLLVEKPARIYGHSMLIPIDIIRKYDFMDTKYFLFCEETDYTRSLYELGVESYFVPKAIITHVSTSTFKLSPEMKYVGMYYGTRNKVYFDKKFKLCDYTNLVQLKGGVWNLCKFFIVQILKQTPKDADYYTNLGLLHGLLGIRGKVVKPEKFLVD